MSAADLVLRALRASATGDADAIRALYADHVDGWSAGEPIRTRDELATEVRSRATALSDVRLETDPAELPDGRVVAEWRLTARHTGTLSLGDIDVPATGRPLDLRGAMFAEVHDNRITAFRQYWDTADLLEQLGMLDEAPEPSEART